MAEQELRRALVVTTPTAALPTANGASLRVADVLGALETAGYESVRVTSSSQESGPFDLGVAVSYASAGSLRRLRRRTGRVWFDPVDSWLLVDGSGLRAGHPSYAARAVRDAVRLATSPPADLVTWISAADRAADRGTVRGHTRLVLPGSSTVPAVRPGDGGRRAVLAGDWDYLPNRDGLAWFLDHVLPLLRPLVQDLPWRLEVYGPGAPALPPDVLGRGHVADAGELYQEGDVHLAPVAHGGGVKRKVLAPLLAGLTVVTTPSGAHGLHAVPSLEVCADAQAFAAAVARRMRDPRPTAPLTTASVSDGDDTAAVLAWLRLPS